MTDIINLNSIRSDNCDCNKPKPKEHSCGCHNHKPQPCYLAVDLSDLYFKVKNLFGELKSEWQRAEARSNLGIIDILKLELTDTSLESGGTNVWTMTTLKGGVTSVYKFYVKNGLRGETGPLGKSAYDIYCETTTDYPVKTLALWLSSLKGDQGETGPAGKSAYDIYCENTADYPVKNEQLWLISLKGEPGASGDPGDMFKVASVSMVSCEEITQGIPLPNGSTYYGKVFNWQIKLNNGEFFNFWAPYGTSGSGNNEGGDDDNQLEYRYNVLLFKNYTFGTTSPTTSDFNSAMSTMLASLGSYNTVLLLKDYAGWSEVSPAITNPGYEYTYMGSCVVVNGTIQSRTVIRLTGNTGASGSSTSGSLGQFTSIVFTRSNDDLSDLPVAGGKYSLPIPDNNIIYVNGSPRTIIWNDGIPEGSEKIWASSCIFYDDNNKGNWTHPRLMSDTTTYDVEFAGKYTELDTTPPIPVKWEDATASNPCNSWRPSGATNNTTNQIWFDPLKDSSTDFTKMYWRAERECKNGEWSNWVIVRIKGEKGADGTGGDGPGQQGELGKQGLMGPVIRMSAYVSGTCYVNESQKPLGENEPITTVHYIDVVYYVPDGATSGTYWMPDPNTKGRCAEGLPGQNADWIPAEGFDFAFIETLIANHISSLTIDASEVRIHTNPGDATNDLIVAGMTSGKKTNGTPGVTVGSDDPVRIWAGTSTKVSDTTMDLTTALFRVTQNGNLYAEKADIKGIVLADILRLGEGSFSTCEKYDTPNSVGKLLEIDGTLILPELLDNKVQMFYLLTDTATSDIKVVRGKSPDTITYFDSKTLTKVTGNTDVDVSPNRLYQFFGIDHEWRVCEVTLAPLNVIATTLDGGLVDPQYYTIDECSLTIRDTLDLAEQTLTLNDGTLVILGTLAVQVTNLYTSNITVHIASLPIHIEWGTGNYIGSYDMTIDTNGLVVPVGQQSERIVLDYVAGGQSHVLSNNVFTIRIENKNNLGGLTTTEMNLGPNVSLNSATVNNNNNINLDTFLSLALSLPSSGYKYNFLPTLISATYSRGPSNTTLHASSPSSQGDTGGDASDSVWVQTNLFNVDFSPNVSYESVSVGGVGYEYLTLIEFLLGEEYITSIPETSLSTFEVSNTSSSLNIALTFPDERSIYVYIKYNRNLGTTSSDCFFYGGRLDFVFNGGIDNCTCNTFIIPPATTWKATRLSMTSDKLLYTFNENHLFSMEFKDNNSTFVNARVKKIDAIYFSYTFFDELRTPKAVNNFEHADQLISSFHFSIPEVEGITTRNIPLDVLSQLLTLNRPNN